MSTRTALASDSRRAAGLIRDRIERGGERLWRLRDFGDLPFPAAAQALSRLARRGLIERIRKGIYYRSRKTALGRSRPNPAALRELAGEDKSLFAAGMSAANLLGFTTQNPGRPELATPAQSVPRGLIGDDVTIHLRRPQTWSKLQPEDAALLDFLRHGGKLSELSPEQTIRRTLTLLAERGRFHRLLGVAEHEPPRVRALLGALGEQLGKSPRALKPLKGTLNPCSRFDFGMYSGLTNARNWQAKERR